MRLRRSLSWNDDGDGDDSDVMQSEEDGGGVSRVFPFVSAGCNSSGGGGRHDTSLNNSIYDVECADPVSCEDGRFSAKGCFPLVFAWEVFDDIMVAGHFWGEREKKKKG